MPLTSTTLVAALLYRETMVESFDDLVDDFDAAFRSKPRASYLHSRPYDDFALFQIDGARIVIGHCDDPMGTAAADRPLASEYAGLRSAVVLAVSFPVSEGQPIVLAERRERLCHSIVEQIAGRYPAEMTLWSETGGEFGPDEFDEIVRDLCRVEMQTGERAATEAAAAAEPVNEQVWAEEAREAADLAATELATARRAEAAHASAAAALQAAAAERMRSRMREQAENRRHVANDLPQVPGPMDEAAERVRAALYEDRTPQRGPLVERLTIYALNLTLVAVVAPVGAALLTYNALGRENLAVTARAVALTGIGLAIVQSPLMPALRALAAAAGA